MKEERELTGSGLTEWWMVSGAAGTGTWPRLVGSRGHGCRQQHLGQATNCPFSMPTVAIPASFRRRKRQSRYPDCPGRLTTRSTRGSPWLRQPVDGWYPHPWGGHPGGGHWVGARSGDWREVALHRARCLTGPVQAMRRQKLVNRGAAPARSYSHPDDPEKRVSDNSLRSKRPRSKHSCRKTYKFHDLVTTKKLWSIF
jgi:hypothetical protein